MESSLVESSIGEVDEGIPLGPTGPTGAIGNAEGALVPPPVPERPATTNRYSYRTAIYSGGGRNLLNGGNQDYNATGGDVG